MLNRIPFLLLAEFIARESSSRRFDTVLCLIPRICFEDVSQVE